MNWKNFLVNDHDGCERALKRALAERDTERNAKEILEGTRKRDAEEIYRLRRALKFRDRPASEQPSDSQLLSAFVLVTEETPLWRAVNRILEAVALDQNASVCQPNLSNEARQFNAGRLAMAEEVRDILLQKWTEAQRQNREAQTPNS